MAKISLKKSTEFIRMEPKYKEGELVEFRDSGKRFVGKVYIIDRIPGEGFRYDVNINKPEKILYKHIYEDELKKVKKK